jgi:Raf kinase inhibitor-like YbhB/YbcL family protein
VPAGARTRAVVSAFVIRRGFALLAFGILLATTALTACDKGDGRQLRPAGPNQTASLVNPTTTSTTVAVNPSAGGSGGPGQGVGEGGLTLRAPWEDEGSIDPKYTCKAPGAKPGGGVSPALEWSGVPADATSLAIVVTDLTANGFVHWAVVGIDPTTTGVAEGQPPSGAIEGRNGFGSVGWGGPCPPAGSGEHEYLFQLYAQNRDLGLAQGFNPKPVLDEIEGASTAAVSLVGRFGGTASGATSTTPGPPPSATAGGIGPVVTPGPSPT